MARLNSPSFRTSAHPRFTNALVADKPSYKTEIASFDVATGRSDRFGEGRHENRCILVYSGIREFRRRGRRRLLGVNRNSGACCHSACQAFTPEASADASQIMTR